MSKRKRTAAEKRARREQKERFMTIFIHGKQKRVPRPPLIDGLPIEEFLAHHRQDGLVVFFYEYERGPDPCRVLDKDSIVYRQERYSCLVVAEARGVSSEALREFCTGKLAHYKIPRYVHVVSEFPMTVTGKIRKVEMRQAAVELLGLQSVAAAKHA